MRRMRGPSSRIPAGVAESLGVRRGEKVIAWGIRETPGVQGAQYVVATDRALYEQVSGRRIPWHLVSKAAWDEPRLDLVLIDESGAPATPLGLTLAEANDLPPAVRDRVTDSVVVTERVDLGDGAGALMSARRGSDDGEIRWSIVFDSGLDPADPELRRRASDALVQLRDSLGI